MDALRIGIIGAGFIADTHAAAIHTLADARAVAVASHNLSKAQVFAQNHAIPHAAGDCHELLARSDVDAVVVALPNFLHAQVVEAAAAAGKHVLCEKPLCLTIDEGQKMRDACRRHGVQLVYAEVLPGRGEFAALRDPGGAYFAVVRTERGDPSDHVGGANEWLWFELWTDDPGKAVAFYRDVFGYTVGAADGRADAYVLTAGGRARAGVMRSPDPKLPAAWIPYVRVADLPAAVARAEANGARVVVAPQPHHRSQVAVLMDPLGAPFAMADWRPR